MPQRRILFAALALAACQSGMVLPGCTAYKMDVQQGNVVTQEMLARLKPGMTRNQVRFALGTPLLVDPFRTDRWDYVYLLMKQGNVAEQRRIVAIFKDEKLERIEGDVVPARAGAADVKPPARKPAASGE